MSISSQWLKSVQINSDNKFQSWLMKEVGYDTYLTHRLWDDESLLYYITVFRDDNLYLIYRDNEEKVVRVDFQKAK